MGEALKESCFDCLDGFFFFFWVNYILASQVSRFEIFYFILYHLEFLKINSIDFKMFQDHPYIKY
jgi:hypothetical protein